ncbi:phage capsid protein [Pseudoalteromonas sp. NBT06-2]|uniref:GPO family capsid scaffolding protein n=1 Tax=Pseudoalteromonas sp. NBT06-2 TaxID=2025950 RepID=UPI000BA660A2|nr:GPO family capsid scaffolding protein [Pseudoalteromonas sp. NBT06-2]PAJ72253.1 phage capsid protein [Pseudoalteromonas sp. NBT06-2]
MTHLRTTPLAIAAVGLTVDGREISEKDIDDIVATYNYKKYGARINFNHAGDWSGWEAKQLQNINLNGGMLGDVLEVSTDINDDGVKVLLAVLSPNASFVALNQADQAVYFSIEINRNFMNTEQSYLVGLAVTDKPASTYTHRCKFSEEQPQTVQSKGDTDVTFLKVELGDLKKPKKSIFKNLFNLKKDDEMKPEDLAKALQESLGTPLAQFSQALTDNTEATHKLLEKHSQQQPGDNNTDGNGSDNLSNESPEKEAFKGEQKQAFDEVTNKVDGLQQGINDLTKEFKKALGSPADDTSDSEENPKGENDKYANLL